MKINRLPGVRGTFTAKTEKKTKMFVYQVNGTQEELQLYMQAKEQEGYPAVIDPEYGTLWFTARNLGIEAELDVYTTQEGTLGIAGFNKMLQEADELKSAGVSQESIDRKIMDAISKGKYASKITANVQASSNIGEM